MWLYLFLNRTVIIISLFHYSLKKFYDPRIIEIKHFWIELNWIWLKLKNRDGTPICQYLLRRLTLVSCWRRKNSSQKKELYNISAKIRSFKNPHKLRKSFDFKFLKPQPELLFFSVSEIRTVLDFKFRSKDVSLQMVWNLNGIWNLVKASFWGFLRT